MARVGKLWWAFTGVVCCSAAFAADGMDALFDLDKPIGSTDAGGNGLRWSGYGEFGAAYTTPDPGHWSKLRGRIELAANGRLGERAKFKLSGRLDADGAFDLERQHYPGAVRRDQRSEFAVREAYIDTSAGDWEFRLGRQHVVWGEMVGLFMADVVSARDRREFFLPELESMRIPQWTARAEYYGGDSHFEALWIPVPSYDNVGKPGSDFYPFPLPLGAQVHEKKPGHSFKNANWGLRLSHLVEGWDLSVFYYRSLDINPTLYRTAVVPVPAFELRHDRIRQVGATVSKDFGSFVFKGETVHTHGRHVNTADPSAVFGLKASDTLDYVVGVDIPVRNVWRLNFQHYAQLIYRHEASMGNDRLETGVTALINRKFGDKFEVELQVVSGLNRLDYMLRPKIVWRITQEWRGQFGADVFGGRSRGLFGAHDGQDRVYFDLRRWF
jgi:hypothetical protein